ncbi:MAG: hypothetical protein HY060_03885 [Proteobacteria bacterium]|nr:hypothetical protein [Pseudomonadota bacterium]
MGELIVRDDREMRRLNQAITAFEHRPCSDRMRMQHLLSALLAERAALEKPSRRARSAHSDRR